MRVIPFITSAVITTGLVWALNKPWGKTVPMPMGKFLSPQHGFWQNAEASGYDYNADLKFPDLKGNASVYLDERLVPHIFAENDEDLYFLQGYIHAKFRLFQMDLQTKAAEGRASEIAGPVAVNFDKEQRRLGMRYAAENAVKETEKDPVSLAMFTAYTKGVNAYIHSLKESEIPVEYKLLNSKPEEWSNIRTALLLKMMAKMLSSGTENDLSYTNAKSIFGYDAFKKIYPQVPDSLVPIVPKGTIFDTAGIVPVKPATADSLYFGKKDTMMVAEISKPDKNNGSNNWVVAGSKTLDGAPILCNDPHLELSLPSIWFELQLSTPTSNVYGVSLPGSPFVIIGFNDSIAWGVTNAQRDVKDYFEIKFKDASRKEYWFNGKWEPATIRHEEIKVKGGETVYDTVAYTAFGPVLFDESFSNPLSNKRSLAIRWTAHEGSNEGFTFYKLNRAKNYADYADAIKTFQCPGQNFVFASKTGDIAIWQQGKFPARWEGQGIYVMPGEDDSYNWQGFIPQAENPHAKNPVRGFLESANQRPVDSTYPYFIPGSYITPRGVSIEHFLSGMNGITVTDMMKLQGNYFNSLADDAVPILLKYVNESELNTEARKYIDIVKAWNLEADPASKGQTIYQCWWDSLESAIWRDDISKTDPMSPWPEEQTTMELLARDSSSLKYIDNVNTPEVETLSGVVTSALNKVAADLVIKEAEGKLEWGKFKNPSIYHLIKDGLPAFARKGLNVGGNGNIINAVTHSHGPSWRMIVHLVSETEAYGVYPAGQSGNPGSKYYDNFVDTWVKGEYYKLWVMKASEAADKKVKWVMKFGKG
ncbi:MAG: penicillin acylase family protein [Chitinophagaceae bacterium]|nr:penicillin acylase family protein [Chitinophagaceae bacterium]